MSRLLRRNRTSGDIGIKHSGGLLDLFDNEIKMGLRVNDDEYDFICEVASDDEIGLLVKEKLTFSEKRKFLLMLEKHLSDYKKLER